VSEHSPLSNTQHRVLCCLSLMERVCSISAGELGRCADGVARGLAWPVPAVLRRRQVAAGVSLGGSPRVSVGGSPRSPQARHQDLDSQLLTADTQLLRSERAKEPGGDGGGAHVAKSLLRQQSLGH
jgi:hypothetical protein